MNAGSLGDRSGAGREGRSAGDEPVVGRAGSSPDPGTDGDLPSAADGTRSDSPERADKGPSAERSTRPGPGAKRGRRAGTGSSVDSGSSGGPAEPPSRSRVTAGRADGRGRGASGRERGRERARGTDPPGGSPGDRFRLLAASALGSVSLSYLLAVLVAALAGLTVGAAPAPGALLVAGIPLWLAAHQVPLLIDGAPLGVLPLLPTIGLVALAAAWAKRLTRRLGGRVREDASAAVATLAGTHASVAVLATALPANPAPATPWAALVGGGLVTAAGAALGALSASGPPAWWSVAPGWFRSGLAAARVGAAALASAGALMLIAALLAAVGEVHWRLATAAPGVGAGFGVTLLSVCYLPNALVASIGWLAGPGLSIGTAAASPLFTLSGPLPQVPLMAAFPVARPPGWTVVAFVLPLLAGILLGRHCRRAAPDPLDRLRSAALAVVVVAIAGALLAAVVSGRLAAGPFDPVELAPIAIGASLLAWLGVPAVVMALLPGRPRPLRPTPTARRERPATDPASRA